jgi:lipopolysaccharide transport system permease protein
VGSLISVSVSLERPPDAPPIPSQEETVPPHHERPVTIIDGKARWRRWWVDLVAYRGALYSLAWRNIRSRYKQAALGMAWALIQPTIQVGVFTVLFGVLGRAPSGDVPYPVFALAGLLPWNFFSKVANDGSQSLVTNQHIITKLFFPRIYLVLASSASAIVDAIVTFALLVTAVVYYDISPTRDAFLLVPAFAGLMVFALGFAALLAALNARWRDVTHAVPFLLQIGLFVTPVIYPASLIPERWRWVAALNPLTGWIALFRAATVGSPLPDSSTLLVSVTFSVALAALGLWYFTRAERTIVDVV